MKSTHRPFSPSLMALCGVVVGMCLMAVGLAFAREMSWFGFGLPRVMRAPVRLMMKKEEMATSTETRMKPVSSEDLLRLSTSTLEVPTSTMMDAQKAFEQSPYRVIQAMQSPTKQYIYLIATPRGATDSGCGSRYSQPVCYLLREATTSVSETKPTVVSAWSGGAFLSETAVKFVKKGSGYVMQFTTAEGDGSCTMKISHQIDLVTGQHTVVKQVNNCTKT